MKVFRRFLAGLVMLVLLAFPFAVYFKAQAITDWWQLRGYTPPAAVSSLAAQDTMTDRARHIFYVNRPDLETDAGQFRTDCGVTEKTIILGCYHSNQAGIFVYNVKDARLAGVQQVTSAHEMLHAAYDRLSSKDKNYVDNLLQNYLANGLKDQRIIDAVNAYRQSEPKDVVSEMHSMFGTEIARLPAPLEAYYSRYFTSRQTVAGFAQSYQNEFTSREDMVKADDAQLSQLKLQINAQERQLQSQADQIDQDRAKLDNQKAAGQIAAYNSSVPGFNSEVNAYNRGVERLKDDISTYNKLVDERNSIASELASLDHAIDTRLSPQATQ